MKHFRKEKVKVETWSKGDGTGHYHRNLEIIYVLQGKVHLHLSKEVVELGDKDYWIINSNKWHQVEAFDNTLFIKIQMDYPIIRDIISHDDFYFENKSFSDEGDLVLKKMLTKFSYHHLNSQSKKIVTFSYLASCYEILDILSTYFLKETRELSSKMSKEDRILDYIRSRHNQKITLETLSEHLFLSPSYVSKYFKKHFNVNFKEYLTSVRLAYAYEDLIYTEHSITRVAYDNGFSNLSQFNKDFRLLYKQSPSEVRSSNQEEFGIVEQVEQEQLTANINNQLDTTKTVTVINATSKTGHILNESWKNLVNFGPAATLLERHYQDCALYLRQKLGFRYLRIWGIFTQSLLIDLKRDTEAYNYTKLDQVFDFFFENSLLPHIELGPKHFRIDATTRRELRHKRQEMIYLSKKFPVVFEKFLLHFINRYGLGFVSKWRFELWLDEDELSESFTVSDYFSIFQSLFSIAKKISTAIQFGGCSYPVNYVKYLPSDFFQQWQQKGIKPDFVSMMVYHYNLNQKDNIWITSRNQKEDFLESSIKSFKDTLKTAGWEDLPILVTEWNVSISDRNNINDSLYKGAHLLRNIFTNKESINALSYFIASDWLSDDVDSTQILYGGSGLLSKNQLLKPVAWAYQFLNQLDRYVLCTSQDHILTTDGEGQYSLLIHNQKELNDVYYSTEEDNIDFTHLEQYFDNLDSKSFRLNLQEVPTGKYKVRTSVISKRNELLTIWQALNYEDFLNLEEIEYIRGRSFPEIKMNEYLVRENQILLDLELEPNSFMLLKLSR